MTGQIITFYSYKGGTGRTMALANAAAVLARKSSEPVLMVDWDLEAPGLHRYFPRPKGTDDPGLIELMLELRDLVGLDAPDALDESATRALIAQVEVAKFVTPVAVGQLDNLGLIYAGRMDDSAYPTRVNSFDWERLYTRAPHLFKVLAQKLAQEYGHVMIDSRTGETDTSGICTMLLPDKLVVVFTPNKQSLLGSRDRARDTIRYRQQADDLRPLTIFPLASRVELSEGRLRNIWRHGSVTHDIGGYQAMFEELFNEVYALDDCDLGAYFDDIQIQHVPYYAYGEQIAVLERDAPSDRLSLRKSYETFALALDALDAPWQMGRSGRTLHFNVPLAVRDFTGRDHELAAIEQILEHRDAGLRIVTLVGLEGVGRTTIASRYVQQQLHSYEIVAWLNAEDGGVSDLARLAAALGIAADDLPRDEQAQAALRGLGEGDERWLLVIDDVAAPDQLQSCCPQFGNGSVLITSRHRGLGKFGALLEVDVFAPEVATSYLMTHADQARDPVSAARLAAALGYLPAALSRAAAYCASGTSFREYLRLLNKLPARTLLTESATRPNEQGFVAAIQRTITTVGADAPLAPTVLAMAAYFAPERIPKELFDALAGENDAAQQRTLTDALVALSTQSLARIDGSTVTVHPLVQKMIRDDNSARNDLSGAVQSLDALRRALPVDVSTPSSWQTCEQLLPHILALADAIPEEQKELGAEVIGLLNRIGLYLIWAQPGARSLATAEATLGRAERTLGFAHPATLSARRLMALGCLQAGRTKEAVAILELLVADTTNALGSEHPDTLGTRSNLADAYQDAGRTAAALDIYESLLSDQERLLGTDHPDTLTSRNNLASAYQEAGQTEKAIEIYKPLLTDQQRVLSADHPATLTTRNNLANAYQNAGHTTDAIKIYEPLLTDQQRILGNDHPATLTTRNNLANAHQNAGRITDAIKIYEPLLTDQQRILGNDHPATLTTRNNLASTHQNAGRITDAIKLYEPLLADQDRVFGSDHPATLTTRANLARAYQNAGRATDAIAIYARLLADQERLLGVDHPLTLATRNTVANARRRQGRSAPPDSTPSPDVDHTTHDE